MKTLKLTNGARLIASTQFPHKGDHYLHHVLAEFNGQWVTWVFNETCGGCYEGAYFNQNAEAHGSYVERVTTEHKRYNHEADLVAKANECVKEYAAQYGENN
tara:strand:- start:96 stop:401 length:306 start_codon:yes stop_codon:yes gene_type:complete